MDGPLTWESSRFLRSSGSLCFSEASLSWISFCMKQALFTFWAFMQVIGHQRAILNQRVAEALNPPKCICRRCIPQQWPIPPG